MSFDFSDATVSAAEDTEMNNGIYTTTLFGNRIKDNPVPEWTAERKSSPFVAFQDPVSGKMMGISKDKLSYGLLALADPGGGKTNLLNMITERLIATRNNDDVFIIFDTKGDYYREFAHRVPDSERVVIGTGAEYRDISGIHNIFGEIMPRGADGRLLYTPDSDTDAVDLARQFFRRMGSDTQPVFPAMAGQIFAAAMIHFMRAYSRSDQSMLNNEALTGFLLRSTNEELKEMLERDHMRDYRSCVNYISGKSNQTQGVNSYVGSVIREMFIGPFAKRGPGREYSMMDIVTGTGGKCVFIEYDLKRGEALAPMYGVLIDRALANALGGRMAKRRNVYVLLDEMLLLPELTHLSDALNFGRSQGVKILAGLQNIPGAACSYTEAGAKRMLASFQNIFSFRLSDHDTRQFLIQRLGSLYQNHSFSPQQKNVNVQREGHTVEDWDILSLGFGEAIVNLKGEAPFIFRMPKYH